MKKKNPYKGALVVAGKSLIPTAVMGVLACICKAVPWINENCSWLYIVIPILFILWLLYSMGNDYD